MRALFRKLRSARFSYEPLIVISIHRERMLHNLRQFQEKNPKIAVAPVLKSNAYGHGLVQTAKIVEGENLPFLCVDSYFEALVLRNEGIHTPLLIMGYTPLENILRCNLKNISFTITSLEALRKLSTAGGKVPRVRIHLKLDTGMHRQGILPDELDQALDVVRKNEWIILQGVCSHLADADTPGSAHARSQILLWNSCVRTVRDEIAGIQFFHLSNTAGSHYAHEIDANVMRLGIGLYGFDTRVDQGLTLLPVLEMKTRITSIRTIAAGEKVGYNATFVAGREMTIATIPVGYAEGIDRRLSNQWAVTIGGVICPVVGRINMNITSVDVSNVANPHLDDEVLAISAEHAAPNSIGAMAKMCGTIPYDILTGLSPQIRRTVL